ncbi:MAG: hypothetical protein AAF298_00060 [Cyanobacteria bacterium P01_A01_bin.40]
MIKIQNRDDQFIKDLMNRQKKVKSSGFKRLESKNSGKQITQPKKKAEYGQKRKQPQRQLGEISQICQSIDRLTIQNKNEAHALEKFFKMVNQGNVEKLREYFFQYGVDPEFVKLNLDSLIAEELIDLST